MRMSSIVIIQPLESQYGAGNAVIIIHWEPKVNGFYPMAGRFSAAKRQKGSKPVLTLRIKTFEVFQRALPLPDGLPNLNGGLPPPADGFPWHPIPKTSILQLRLLRSLPSESAHPVTASKNLQFLIATTGKICYDESTNSSQNLNF